MRTVSSAYLRAALAGETDEVLLCRIEISHPQILDGPVRLVSNLEDLTVNGNVYTAFPFEIVLPEDDEEAIPTIRLRIDTVDQQIVEAIRRLPPSPPPEITIALCLASQPNVVEAQFEDLILREVPYDAFSIDGTLALDEDDLEPYPQYSFTPALFPGMF